jgi:hypothetical protein
MSGAYPIIGLRGSSGAGKDTLAALIRGVDQRYTVMKFAEKVRRAASALAAIPVERMWTAADKAEPVGLEVVDLGEIGRRTKEAADICGLPPKAILPLARRVCEVLFRRGEDNLALFRPIEMTVGRLLQLVGVECFRELFGPTVWIDAFEAEWRSLGSGPILISDVRFPEETAWIRRKGGIIVEIRRDADRPDDGRSLQHQSERALDGEHPDYIVNNDGAPEDLLASFLARMG